MTDSRPGAAARDVVAGIDVGGTTMQVVLVDSSRRVVGHASTHTPAADGGAAILDAGAVLVDYLLERHDRTLRGIGVGAAGVVDSEAGRILVVSDSFTGWAGFDVRGFLESRYAVPVTLANDVNAFLAGEMIGGAGVGRDNALGITLGTGVGGALWLGGRLFTGSGGAAGEIGHAPGFGNLPCTCGEKGHLETLASGRSISGRYERATGERVSAVELAARAHAGDTVAAGIFRQAGEGMARAILITTALLDIETVVIGGGVSNAWSLIHPAIVSALDAEPPVRGGPPAIVRGELGDSGVAQGAAALAYATVVS
jgi:glucokinase